MDFAKTFTRLQNFEDRLKELGAVADEIRLRQRRMYEQQKLQFQKMMDGFHAINRAFKCNCNAQIALCGQIDEMQGGVTDLSLYSTCPVSSASES